ncbi:hypothetical protein RhiJN_20975 [Ceratobasidium sp. AG-Ba]|nr:hypothetical protein RhiJN_20975 [Ceratobasidium sp. AG-Ba]
MGGWPQRLVSTTTFVELSHPDPRIRIASSRITKSIMSLVTLLVSIPLTAIALSLPGFAPYVHEFVSVAKYPAYAYLAWQYAPLVLRHLSLVDLITVRVARLSQLWQSGRRLLSPYSLLSATLALFWGVSQALVIRAGLFRPTVAMSRILAAYRHKGTRLAASVRLSVQVHFHRYLVEPYSLFTSSLWPCTLSHVMVCVVTSSFDFMVPTSIWPTISKYPLSFFVGLLVLIAMRRCALKVVSLVALCVDVVAYAYLSAISRLARMTLSLKLGDWIVLILSLKYVFGINNISCHDMARFFKYTIIAFVLRGDILAQQLSELRLSLQPAARQCAFQLIQLVKYSCTAVIRLLIRLVILGLYLVLRQAGRLLFKHMLAHVVRPLVIIVLYWTCLACVMGCVLAATTAIELFAAMIVPLYQLYSLVQLRYKPSKDVASMIERPAPPFEPNSLPPVPSETRMSTPPTSLGRSRSATSDGVGRLARLINAYMDESASGESVAELENQFKITRSMHAPPTTQMTSPPTPLLSIPTTPAPGSPVPPPAPPANPALTPTLTPDLTFESGDEDEEIASLATRLSNFHIERESGSAPRESKCVSPRAEIVFEVYSPSPRPGPVIPVQERRTGLELQLGGNSSLYLETDVGQGMV